jgi:hypothetical protein
MTTQKLLGSPTQPPLVIPFLQPYSAHLPPSNPAGVNTPALPGAGATTGASTISPEMATNLRQIQNWGQQLTGSILAWNISNTLYSTNSVLFSYIDSDGKFYLKFVAPPSGYCFFTVYGLWYCSAETNPIAMNVAFDIFQGGTVKQTTQIMQPGYQLNATQYYVSSVIIPNVTPLVPGQTYSVRPKWQVFAGTGTIELYNAVNFGLITVQSAPSPGPLGP